jgi:lysozyme family protein
MTLDERITALIRREAGFVDNPADRGGPTKFGITLAKLAEVLGHPASVDDVRDLPEAVAREIYRHDFETAGLDAAPEAAQELLLDILTNHGPGNFARIVQRALGVPVDGAVGPQTRAALAAADGAALFRRLGAERLRFTGRAISKNLRDDDHDGIPDNTEFAEGWLNRQAAFWEVTP